jgi:hypothetical protein
MRGAITGGGTFIGGVFHTLPFLITSYRVRIVVAVELLVLASIRYEFFQTSFARSFLSVTVGGAIISALSAALGVAAGDGGRRCPDENLGERGSALECASSRPTVLSRRVGAHRHTRGGTNRHGWSANESSLGDVPAVVLARGSRP